MPKYVFEDVPLFKGLIKDLFPGLDAPRVGYEDLKIEVAAHLTANGYKCSDDAVHKEQCDKVIQMYETMIVRCVSPRLLRCLHFLNTTRVHPLP